jgi:hypothetical protein
MEHAERRELRRVGSKSGKVRRKIGEIGKNEVL